jgi:hypothetical protein
MHITFLFKCLLVNFATWPIIGKMTKPANTDVAQLPRTTIKVSLKKVLLFAIFAITVVNYC